jgi:hypothetical protein
MALLIQVLTGYGMQSPAVRDDQGALLEYTSVLFHDDRQVLLGDVNAGILHRQFEDNGSTAKKINANSRPRRL